MTFKETQDYSIKKTQTYSKLMPLHKQTQMHTDVGGPIPGDCWRTALACLLGIRQTTVPHFLHMYGDDEDYFKWWKASVAFVERNVPGMTLVYIGGDSFPAYIHPDTCPPTVVASGKSPRGDFNHCVLVDSVSGDLVWDVHPSRKGIDSIEGVYLLTYKEK